MSFKFATPGLSSEIDSMVIINAINECRKRIDSGAANSALQRWFGDTSMEWKKTAKQRLEQMRRVINLQEITIGVRDLDERNTGENAAALPGSATSIVPGTTQSYKGRQVLLNSAFNRLPRYLPMSNGVTDTTGWNQSKFETVIHELTHVILSTDDEKLANGNNAYGAQRAKDLATENSAKAKNNAENWAIFIEACGKHRTS